MKAHPLKKPGLTASSCAHCLLQSNLPNFTLCVVSESVRMQKKHILIFIYDNGVILKCNPCLSKKPRRKLLLSILFALHLTNLNGSAKSCGGPPQVTTSYYLPTPNACCSPHKNTIMLTLLDLARPCSTSARPCSTLLDLCSTSPRPLFCHCKAVFDHLQCLIPPGGAHLVVL